MNKDPSIQSFYWQKYINFLYNCI